MSDHENQSHVAAPPSHCVVGATETWTETGGWRTENAGCVFLGSRRQCEEFIIRVRKDRARNFVGTPLVKKWNG